MNEHYYIHIINNNKIKIIFIIIFFNYLVLSFYGYGSDNDTYGIIRSGQNLILNGVYGPSRFQGALIPEIIIGISSLIGGFYLSNLISVILGLFSLILFYNILKQFIDNEKAMYAILLVALNPYYILASTTSMDYIYSVFFIFLVLIMLNKRFFLLGALFSAMAISSRLSNSLIILVVFMYYLYLSYEQKDYNLLFKYFITGILGIFFTCVLFIPAFISYNYKLDFFTYGIGDWDIISYLSRFVYKNIMLYGVIPFFILLIIFIKNISKFKLNKWTFFLLLAFLLQELLFLKIPLEISYLLPLIFITFSLICFIVSKKILKIIAFIIFLNNFITLDILSITYNKDGTEAIDAKVGLYIEKGIIFQDIEKREKVYEKYKDNILSIKKKEQLTILMNQISILLFCINFSQVRFIKFKSVIILNGKNIKKY